MHFVAAPTIGATVLTRADLEFCGRHPATDYTLRTQSRTDTLTAVVNTIGRADKYW